MITKTFLQHNLSKQYCCIAHVFALLNLSEDNIKLETESNEEEDINIMSIEEMFNKDYDKDFILKRVLIFVREEINHFKDLTLIDCKKIEDKLYYRNRKYVSIYHVLKLRLFKITSRSFSSKIIKIESTSMSCCLATIID